MKKFMAIFASFTILIASVPLMVASAEAFEDTNSKLKISELTGLAEALQVDVSVQGETVTRGEFITALMGLMNLSTASASASFTDVDYFKPVGAAVVNAVNLGILSESDTFHPDQAVTYQEAAKMAVSALGYDSIAKLNGGYPYGYTLQAGKLHLNEDVITDENGCLTPDNYRIFLRNVIAADAYSISGIEGDGKSFTYRYHDRGTLLEIYRDIYEVSGVLEANAISFLYDEEQDVDDDKVIIDSVTYRYATNDFLGKKVTGFYTEDGTNRTLLYLGEADNDIFTLTESSDAVFESDRVIYYDEKDKEKHLSFSSDIAVLYNGKADKHASVSDIDLKDSKAELIDNDNDGKYECIAINHYSYLIVSRIDAVEKKVYDDNLAPNIDLSDNDVDYTIDNGTLKLTDIMQQDCLEYTVSKDGKYYEIHHVTASVDGIVTSSNEAEQKIYIDDQEYDCTNYFIKYLLKNTKINASVKLYLSSNGTAISCGSYTAPIYQYGYLCNTKETVGLEKEGKLKIFTDEGKLAVFILADKVRLNDKVEKSEAVMPLLAGADMLIRFSLNADGKIRCLNTEAPETGYFDSAQDDENLLKRYRFAGDDTTASIYYRNSGFFSPYLIVDNATKLFRIMPASDVSDEEDRYSITTPQEFVLGSSTIPKNTIRAYNVGQDGYAAAMIYYSSGVDMSKIANATYGIVSAVSRSMDPNGNEATKLVLYVQDKYTYVYVKDDAPFLSGLQTGYAPGEAPFTVGDMLRYSVNDKGYLLYCSKDFSGKSNKILTSSSSDYSGITYYYGTLQYVGTKSLSILCDAGTASERVISYPFTQAKYGYVSQKSGIFTYPTAQLMGYLQNGNVEQKVLLKCKDAIAEQLIVFE